VETIQLKKNQQKITEEDPQQEAKQDEAPTKSSVLLKRGVVVNTSRTP
jgi:hypothetical protein